MSKIQLTDIQATILKGHGRKHMRCCFLAFNKDTAAIKKWLGGLVPKITSTDEQIKSANAYRTGGNGGRTLFTCSFTKTGLDKLKLDQALVSFDPSFSLGMDKTKAKLNDIPKDTWEQKYQNTIDALVIIADNSLSNLAIFEEELAQGLRELGAGKLLFSETGNTLRSNGRSVEHFGYVDGISQPQFLNGKELIEENLGLVLVKEKNGGHGSYLVFRKLEQNVARFNAKVKKLAVALDISPDLAGAQVIGRFKSGALLTETAKDLKSEFDYKSKSLLSDRNGMRCPFHAHVRKVNPRSGVNSDKIRIARRGMTYDERGRDPLLRDEPEDKVGVLFMCFQASIQKQFEVIQAGQSNNPNFPKKSKKVGIDPIIGQSTDQTMQQWPKTWNDKYAKTIPYDFRDVVHLKGGAYFYTPSITFLQKWTGVVPPSNKELAAYNAYASNFYSIYYNFIRKPYAE